MTDEFLSQDELDALLKDIGTEDKKGDSLSQAIKEFFNSGTTALSIVIGKEVTLDIKDVKEGTIKDLAADVKEGVAVNLDFTEGVKGSCMLVLSPQLAVKIADLMMGGTGETEDLELNDIKLSAISEAFNQMIGASTTSFSEKTKEKINISTPKAELLNKESSFLKSEDPGLCFEMNVKIEDCGSFEAQLLSEKALAEGLGKMFHPDKEEPPAQKQVESQEKVKVEPAKFQEFEKPQAGVVESSTHFDEKLELLLDVPLRVVVELGRAKMTLKQVLDLNIGSLLELDKLTGEPVDILVNGKLIAKGEVVVVDENFGVRITEIVTPRQRLYSLKEKDIT